MLNKKQTFSQKHPFIFGFFLILMAMVLLFGTMAFFYLVKDKIKFPFLAQKKIGIVYIQGTIVDSKDIINWIKELKKDKEIVGVLLRINSPGGVVAPSQEIYEAVRELDKVKPVVVSMGSIAASGAYYISCGAREIVANPGTITGSIGVIAKLTSVKKLLDKIGIEDESIASGKFKEAGSPFKKLSPEQKKYLQDMVNDLHNQFIRAVAQGRHMKLSQVEAIADGKAYTGKQAKKLGLVDILGNMDKALEILKRMCNIKGEVELLEGPEKKKTLLQKIIGTIDEKNLLLKDTGVFYYIFPFQLGL